MCKKLIIQFFFFYNPIMMHRSIFIYLNSKITVTHNIGILVFCLYWFAAKCLLCIIYRFKLFFSNNYIMLRKKSLSYMFQHVPIFFLLVWFLDAFHFYNISWTLLKKCIIGSFKSCMNNVLKIPWLNNILTNF